MKFTIDISFLLAVLGTGALVQCLGGEGENVSYGITMYVYTSNLAAENLISVNCRLVFQLLVQYALKPHVNLVFCLSAL